MESLDLEKIFKLQLTNFINELSKLNNDSFMINLKTELENRILNNNFIDSLKIYFNEDFEKAILSKRENYFLNNNEYLLPISKENIIKIKIRSFWINLGQENKDKVWEYLNLLIKLYKKL